MRSLNGTTDSMDMSLNKLRKIVKDKEACVLKSTGSQRVGHDLATERQQVCICQSQSPNLIIPPPCFLTWLGPPLENNPEIPPSSRDEGLRLLHGLATNLATSLQTPQEA